MEAWQNQTVRHVTRKMQVASQVHMHCGERSGSQTLARQDDVGKGSRRGRGGGGPVLALAVWGLGNTQRPHLDVVMLAS